LESIPRRVSYRKFSYSKAAPKLIPVGFGRTVVPLRIAPVDSNVGAAKGERIARRQGRFK
jgi:hypothetical protein